MPRTAIVTLVLAAALTCPVPAMARGRAAAAGPSGATETPGVEAREPAGDAPQELAGDAPQEPAGNTPQEPAGDAPQKPAGDAPAGVTAAGRWRITAQPTLGLNAALGGLAPAPAAGLAIGKRHGDHLEIEGRFLLVLPEDDRSESVIERSPGQQVTLVRTEEERLVQATIGINYFLTDGGVRPFFSYATGFGVVTGRRRTLERPADDPTALATLLSERETKGLGFANVIGGGVEVPVGDRWALRPFVTSGILLPGGDVTALSAGVGVTWVPGRGTASSEAPGRADEPAGVPDAGGGVADAGASAGATAGARAGAGGHAGRPGDRTDSADPPERGRGAGGLVLAKAAGDAAAGWPRVQELGRGAMLQVTLRGRTWLTSDDGDDTAMAGGTLLGVLAAAAGPERLLLRIDDGDARGSWWIHRDAIARVETGHLVDDPLWEGVLGGLAVGAGVGVLLYLSYGTDGEDAAVLVPIGTALAAPPAALLGGLADHFHRGFEVTGLIYER